MAAARSPKKLATRAVVVLVVASLLSIPLAVRLWTDHLWFSELGYASVYWTRIWSQLAVGGAFGTIAFCVLFGNVRLARRLAPRTERARPLGEAPLPFDPVIERIRSALGRALDKVALAVTAGLALVNGIDMSERWETFRLALAQVPFGYTDPQFGVDVGFFVFRLPAHVAIAEWLTGLLLLTAVLSTIVHLVDGAIRPGDPRGAFEPHVKAHLSVLAALVVLSRAYAYWIAIWELDFSLRGQVVGASYTDVHAELPALRILVVISLAVACALLLNIRARGWRIPAAALGVWAFASVLLGALWPGIVQRFVVAPNEARLEAPYIERNIAMTRRAFGLTDVSGKSFPAAETLTARDVRANDRTLRNVRLWDPGIVKQGYRQLQTIRPYYEFTDVDVDRYTIGGQLRQVLVSAREMNASLLPVSAQTWVNRHLVYTHGFGLVMSLASDMDARGLPRFVIGDVPPRVMSEVASGSPALEHSEPRIYFGESTTDYVIVNTGIEEFDYPLGERNATYRYRGKAGVEIGPLLRRLAWAVRLGSSQVLFSEYLRADSRVLMRRDIRSRLSALAPWLVFEDDPYPALVNGRIVWIIDAYTVTSDHPYAQRVGGVSYVRNSVKATIDAFSGETTFYAFDPSDPILAAWRRIFPALFQEAGRIPADVRAHFRYPSGLFKAQAEIYRTYHMTDPGVFYNKEDQWEIPGERRGDPMDPFFVLLQLPGAAREHFYLMQPFTPRGRDNMIGWMAASSDPENYGERTVYLFPKERVVLGPEQIRARINQDPVISPQLSLWNQRGSEVLFGNMLVIPIASSVVYIQPLFLQAEQTAIPELTRVVVVYADKVEMERTLEAALLKVFGEQAGPSGGPTGSTGPPTTPTASEAARLYQQAIEAQRSGDWARYGELIRKLGEVLSELAERERGRR